METAATETLAEPADGETGVSVPKFVLVLTPNIFPVIDDGLILPAEAKVLVG